MQSPLKLVCRDTVLDLAEPVVMGILNVTPDSFSDGGRHADIDAAVEWGLADGRGGCRHHRRGR